MELYIEKEFLDNFFLDYSEEQPTYAQKTIRMIFKEYGDKKSFMNYSVDSHQEFELLKIENPFFAELASHFPPIEIIDLKDHFFKNSKCFQTIILTRDHKEWFDEAEEKGALCMSFENYEEKILRIIDNAHFRIDLSENFGGWEVFNFCNSLPLNFITLNDNYILSDKDKQKMDKNIIQLFKIMLLGKKLKTTIKVLSKDFNSPRPGTPQQVNETAEKKHLKLNSALANFKKEIITINSDLPTKHDLHDRVLMSNFFMVDSGKGFNLIPHHKSNSQIICESIFDKYTYKRLKNNLNMIDDYCATIDSFESVYFKTLG